MAGFYLPMISPHFSISLEDIFNTKLFKFIQYGALKIFTLAKFMFDFFLSARKIQSIPLKEVYSFRQ